MDDAPVASFDEVRAALEVIERTGETIIRSLDEDDLTAADTALDERQRALAALDSAMSRADRRWRELGGPGEQDVGAARAIAERVRRAAGDGRRLTAAVERAQGRAHDGLRQVRGGSRLATHQRWRGETRSGGWFDAKG